MNRTGLDLRHRPVYTRLICLLLAIVLLGCGQSKEKAADNYIKSARGFVSRNKPETAVIEYKNAIEADPENYVALFELAETYIVMHKISSALRYYNLAAKVRPDDVSARLRLAQIYFQTDRLIDARSELSKVLEISPESVNALHIMSGIQIKERDLDAAVKTLKKARSIDPSNVKTHTTLAGLYIKQKRIPDAVAAYKSAISQGPSDRSAYMGLAKLYAYLKKWDQVESLLRSVIRTGGNLPQKYVDLAEFYQGQKKPDLAETYFHKAVAESDSPVLPTMALARFFARQNQKEKAVETLESILTDSKNKPLVLTGLSQVYLHFNDIDAAAVQVEKALAINNRFEDALSQKAKVLMARQEYVAALKLLDQVLVQNRAYAKAYYLRALCIKERGVTDRPEQALLRAAAGMLDNPEEFEKDLVKKNLIAAVTLDPGLKEARFELATFFLLEKRADKAKEQIRAMLATVPPDHRIMALVAGVALLEGDVKEAEKIYKTIVEENPDFLPARIRLGLLYRSLGRVEDSIRYLESAYREDPRQIGLADQILAIYAEKALWKEALENAKVFSNLAGPPFAAFFENRMGEIYNEKGDLDSALTFYRQSVEKDPDYIRPYMNMGKLFWVQNKINRALEQFKKAETLAPKTVAVLMALGEVYDVQNNLEMAAHYYGKVLEINSRHALAANNLAFIWAENPGRLEEAFRLAKMARNLRPEDPNVLDTMGWVFFQKGSFRNALSELKESLEKDPDNAMAHYHYGMALYKSKSFKAARQHLRKALSLDPGFRDADMAKKMLN